MSVAGNGLQAMGDSQMANGDAMVGYGLWAVAVSRIPQ
jgi:hypothetical protein